MNLKKISVAKCTGKVFSDVSSSLGDLCGYIEAAAKAGIVNKNASRFRPTDFVTRAESLKMILSAEGIPPITEDQGFTDLGSDTSLNGFINAAAKAGIVNKNIYFNPNTIAIRGVIFKIAANAAGLMTPPSTSTPNTTPVSSTNISQSIQSKIETQVLPLIDTTGKAAGKTPGMVVGVITKDFTGTFGFGTKVINTNQKPDGDTFFDIGSVSKVFTSLILADEVSRGSLSLDQSVVDFMEGTLKSLLPKSLTFRNLVSHTSGLNSMPENIKDARASGADGYVWWAPARNYERADLVNCLQKSKCMPNQNNLDKSSVYSNLGISILGMALQDKLGFSSFDEMLQTKISNPLDMADTGTNVPDFISKIASRSASGYGMNNRVLTATPQHADMGSMSPAGEIISTANDLLKFMAVLTGINTSVLDKASTYALTPLATGKDATEKIGYAVAIEGADTSSPIYSKSGGTQGFSSYIIWKRNPQIGIVILTNKNGLKLSAVAESLLNEF